MKNRSKIIVCIAIVVITAFVLTACPDPTDTPPTLRLDLSSVTLNDGNLEQTVTVGGTATGAVTLNTAALPVGVTAAVVDTTITITGINLVIQTTGSYIIGVTRQDITQNLTV